MVPSRKYYDNRFHFISICVWIPWKINFSYTLVLVLMLVLSLFLAEQSNFPGVSERERTIKKEN